MWHSAVSYTQLMVSEVPRMDRNQCRDCHTIYSKWDHSVSCCLKPTKLILLESLLTEVCIMSVFAWTYFFQGWWEPHWTALFWDCSILLNKKIKLIKGTYACRVCVPWRTWCPNPLWNPWCLMIYKLEGMAFRRPKKEKCQLPLFKGS